MVTGAWLKYVSIYYKVWWTCMILRYHWYRTLLYHWYIIDVSLIYHWHIKCDTGESGDWNMTKICFYSVGNKSSSQLTHIFRGGETTNHVIRCDLSQIYHWYITLNISLIYHVIDSLIYIYTSFTKFCWWRETWSGHGSDFDLKRATRVSPRTRALGFWWRPCAMTSITQVALRDWL